VIRPATERARGLVSYQIAEDASAPHCAPSYVLRSGGGEPVGSPMSQVEVLMIAAALAAGHAVSVPDWEGPAGALFAPRQAGYLALDGIRAAERFTRLGLRGRRTRVAAWGYSGGGFATSWTAQLHPRYAPEIRLVGAAIGAPIITVRKTFAAINGGGFSGFYPSILPGMLRANRALRRAFHAHLTPAGRELIRSGDEHCLATNLALHAGLDLDDYLDIPFETLLQRRAVRRAFQRMNPGGRPTAPLLVYQAVHDELVLATDTAGTSAGGARGARG
jgi:pimeloyl-ACP methyl ester carboxylesterase